MTGGGFGGSIIVLAERDRAQALADEIAAAVEGAHGFVTRAGDGVREL